MRLFARYNFILQNTISSLLIVAIAIFGSYPGEAHAASVQTFTTVGTTSWTVPSGVYTINLLVVGGGGGGGTSASGGGGAGGYISNTSYAVTPGAILTVTVGAGGASGSNGSDSVFNDQTAVGGGAGKVGAGNSGGSGGASAGGRTVGQGNVGGTHTGDGYAGGGGAGSAGSTGTPSDPGGQPCGKGCTTPPTAAVGGNGGSGLSNSITGGAVTYAAGGKGISGSAGAANTGNGGAGGQAGGSGIIVVSFTPSNSPTRRIRLFEGYKIKIYEGIMKIQQI